MTNQETDGLERSPASDLIRGIRESAKGRGISMSMHKGWDVVARLLFGKSYSQSLAAERAGKLPPPSLDTSRTQGLRDGHYGWYLEALADIAAEEFGVPREGRQRGQ
jgi:hypothetical protein